MKNLSSDNGFVKSVSGSGVSSGHDENVCTFVSCIYSGLNSHSRFIAADNGFSLSMATTFGCDLIFQHDAGKTGLGIALNGSFDIDGIAKSSVPIAPNGNGNSIADVLSLIEHFSVRNETGVG